MTYDKIKFSSLESPDFINELRTKVKEYFEKKQLSKYGDGSLVAKSVFMVSLFLAPYILMVSGAVTSFPGIFISFILMGFGMAGIGMALMHDANHGTYSKNRKVNKWLSKSLYLLGGFPPNWRHQHNTMHHGYTNIDGHDEDIDPTGILRFSPHKPLYKIHRFQQWYAWLLYGLMTISWVTAKDFTKLWHYKKKNVALSRGKTYRQLLVDLIIAKVFYFTLFLVIPLIVLPLAWYWIVLLFLAMHFVSGVILSTVFQTAHVMPTSAYPLPDEKGNLENNWAIHQLLTTSDFSPKNKVLSWLIGGLNFQVEHHLFPNISHVHYRHLSHLVKTTAQKYNLPYYVQSSFFGTILNHFRMLRALGRG